MLQIVTVTLGYIFVALLCFNVIFYLLNRRAIRLKSNLSGIGYYSNADISKLAWYLEGSDKKVTLSGFQFLNWGVAIVKDGKRASGDFRRPTPIRDDEYPQRKSNNVSS